MKQKNVTWFFPGSEEHNYYWFERNQNEIDDAHVQSDWYTLSSLVD